MSRVAAGGRGRTREGVHAVMAIDPGGTTGLAAGYVEVKPTLAETLATIRRRKSVEVKGDWIDQGRDIGWAMTKFVFSANVEELLPLENIHIVLEDFVLRRREAGGATGNLTSIWVAAAAVSAFAHAPLDHGHTRSDRLDVIHWQMASHAKTTANNDRLKRWGLWEVGSEHKRDAWRHFAQYINKHIC